MKPATPVISTGVWLRHLATADAVVSQAGGHVLGLEQVAPVEHHPVGQQLRHLVQVQHPVVLTR
jgi:hypothetical protein